jgi:hypothetical protein
MSVPVPLPVLVPVSLLVLILVPAPVLVLPPTNLSSLSTRDGDRLCWRTLAWPFAHGTGSV